MSDNNENKPEATAQPETTAAPVTATETHTVSITGEINRTFQINDGEKLTSALTAEEKNYSLRSGSTAFGKDRVVTSDLELTAVARASGG